MKHCSSTFPIVLVILILTELFSALISADCRLLGATNQILSPISYIPRCNRSATTETPAMEKLRKFKWKWLYIVRTCPWKNFYLLHLIVVDIFIKTIKIASLGRQEPQPTGTAKWQTTLRFGKILGITSVVRSIENPQDVLQKIHRPWFLTSSFHILKPKKQL